MITRQQAEDRYGSTANLAAILGIQPQTVAGWEMEAPIPSTHQKTLAGWVDRDFWIETYREISDFYPVFGGASDRRVRRKLIA